MCGRTTCGLAPEQLCHACQHRTKESESPVDALWRDHPANHQTLSTTYTPNYNLCPTQFGPVLLSGGHDCLRLKVNEMEPCTSADRIVMPMQWGFVPCYYKKALADLKVKSINCRIETLREKKGPFSAALNKNQRCVVLADGFYEWKGDKPKVPHLFYWKQNSSIDLGNPDKETVGDDGQWAGRRLLKMAGIFDYTQLEGEEHSLFSYAVVTVESADWFKKTHERMPALLDTDAAVDQWLDVNVPTAEALQLLKPYTHELASHPVDRKFVNDRRFHGADCVRPSSESTPIKSPQDKKMLKKFGTPPKKNLLSYFKRLPTSDVKDDEPPIKIAKKEEEEEPVDSGRDQ